MPAQAWVTLAVGLAAIVGVLVSWRQKNDADRRSEWWRRTTWAFERTLSDVSAEAEIGWAMLSILGGSRLATKSESDVVHVIAEYVAVGGSRAEDGRVEQKPQPNRSLRVRVAAAKAAVAASKRSGRPVDPRVKELAELELTASGVVDPRHAPNGR